MPAGIPVTCSPSRSGDGELSHSGVPVADPHLLCDTHCWQGGDIEVAGSRLPSGMTYTEEVINALARKSKQRGHLPGVGRVLSRRATDIFRSDDKFSQMLTQYESSPEFGNAIESDGCGDD
ncbi:hypothetical protein Tco_1441819 [Tanacetum coccineum]